jgi:hypothetical protein
MEKPLSEHPTVAWLISAERDSFSRLGHRLAMASSDLLTPATRCFRVGRRGQPSVSVSTVRSESRYALIKTRS